MEGGLPAMDVPVRIGPYRLAKNLGIGSFGKVKLGQHEISKHKVAVKILNRNKIRSLDMDEKVRREIQNLKRFRHPHIIKLYEVISTPTDIFVVTEYAPGGELFDYIVQKGRLTEDEARHVFQQIVTGVEYCHFHQVVHRDLKPENLLLDQYNHVKIADFGLSNMMEDGTFLRTSCGSPNYAAPEVISGLMYAGPEVDVWSCGVILYALLCGSLPFDDESIPNLFKKIKSGHYKLPGHLPPLAADLIPRLLVVDPMKRITIPEIRRHPWFRRNLPHYLSRPPKVHLDALVAVTSTAPAAPAAGGAGGAPTAESVVFDDSFDDEIGRQVVALGVPHLNSLEVVRELVARKDRQVSVMYELFKDSKRAILRKAEAEAAASRKESTPTFSPALGPTGVPYVGGGTEVSRRKAQFLASGPPAGPAGGHFGAGGFKGYYAAPANSAMSSGVRKRRWYLGIQSKKDPAHVMTEVFRALYQGDFEWKVLAPYRVRCRWAPPGMESRPEPQWDVKIALQLYKVQRGIYLLDLQKASGDAFVFMNLCARIITELKVPASAPVVPAAIPPSPPSGSSLDTPFVHEAARQARSGSHHRPPAHRGGAGADDADME
mmetsp:Transcript_7285/g.26070  ORF Transcript_7285/g.26070 Transcript_7285/m.26070 type:complete len:603 (-) Transcript_7285:19-1827(-)